VSTPTEAQIVAAARALNKRHAQLCGVNEADSWNIQSDDFKEDAFDALTAALAAPGQAPQPVAWRVCVDGLWLHAKDRDGLIAAIGVKFGRSVGQDEPEPLYAGASPQAAVPAGMMLVPEDVIRNAAGSLGCFCSDEGWGQEDIDNLDTLLALLAARPQAQPTPTDTPT
jgi:hypothetical protein